MKKLFLLVVAIAMMGCSTDDVTPQEYTLEILPIRSVIDMPTVVNYNDSYVINYTYSLPTNCHTFSDLYYLTEGTERTVAVISRRINPVGDVICEDLPYEEIQGQFTFHVLNNNGTYVFKFWQGLDENGQDEYLVYEVPIEP